MRRCFAPLARWVLAHWPGRQVAVALDATSLGDRLTILAVSVVDKGCAVPIAWKLLPANHKHAGKPEWLALLDLVAPALPADWQVSVLTDRASMPAGSSGPSWTTTGIRSCASTSRAPSIPLAVTAASASRTSSPGSALAGPGRRLHRARPAPPSRTAPL